MGIDEHVCPVCGQPVATVVRRHKTLGAWVPVWGPGPCRNHECTVYVDEAVEAAEAAAEKPRAVARRTHGSHGAHGGHGDRAGHGGQAGHSGRAARPGEAEAVAEPAEATDPAPVPAEERTEEKA
ncbi:hypothetical protein [Streptomyces sp. 11x1]|uniref:hypothetical protein n=1 Tax=Streptomyces sp. 11x1 TaxID=3038642 RepID=UPI00292D6F8A|nr:hypothetical protein [Streptomyces sp. 11x1]WNZ14852.1 hypothetical protein P8T65_15020 [Streptomyces sp. 11x1]